MKVCFIGSHLGLPEKYLPKLKEIIIKLIDDGYDIFYCGTYGAFDRQVVILLNQIKKDYPSIRIVKIKPYYQCNKFLNKQSKCEYQNKMRAIRFDYGQDEEGLSREIEKFERDFTFKTWFEDEQKLFDEVLVCDLTDKPYKAHIIECNKWKVDECDVLVAYCPIKGSNSEKIKAYALKKRKKVVEI